MRIIIIKFTMQVWALTFHALGLGEPLVLRKAYDLFATLVFSEYRTDANPYQRERCDKPARRAAPRRR